jgi:hypothetical protein
VSIATAMTFGKFSSFAKFIESYQAARRAEIWEMERSLPMEERVVWMRKQRDVVETTALLKERQPDDVDGSRHFRLIVHLKDVIECDVDVKQDVQDNLDTNGRIFVSIRYGDSMGITQGLDQLESALEEGTELKLRGEWITKEKAYSHGGEQLSVLHFTHRPLGFVCTPSDCYR